MKVRDQINLEWSQEWAHLSHTEIRRRIQRELCEHCGAEPGLPCHTASGRTHWEYRHAERMLSAMQTFNRERLFPRKLSVD